MTASRLNRWGHDISIICPDCGFEDTVFHQIWSDCPIAIAIRQEQEVQWDSLIAAARADSSNPLYSRGWVTEPPLSSGPAINPPIRFETYGEGGP